MGKRLSKNRLIELYHEQDMTQAEIAEQVGVSQPTIGTWMRDAGVDTDKPRDEDLKSDLQRVADELGKTPSYDQYREHGEYGANTVKRRFDGWNAAKEAAGVATTAPDKKVSQEELLSNLKRVAEQLGKSPTQRELNEHGDYAHKLYYKRFDGGLTEAKERIGIEPNQPGQRVSVACANCGGELERRHSDIKHKEKVFCGRECLWEYRSEAYTGEDNPAWNSVQVDCEACGETLLRQQYLIERYDRYYCDNECYSEWCSDVRHGENHPQWTEYPTVECEWCGAPFKVRPAKEGTARFCSWQCTNSWKSGAYKEEANPNWQGGRLKYMGANWPEQRQNAIVRDQARCQGDGCNLTDKDHVEQFGRGLHVHHITPRKEFHDANGMLDWEQSNRLENLVTLCNACHSEAEAANT